MLPYLGIYLKDLLYIDESMSTYVRDTVINYRKLYRYAQVYTNITTCQYINFPIKLRPTLQQFLTKDREILSDNEIYKLSKWIEPPKDGVSRKGKHK